MVGVLMRIFSFSLVSWLGPESPFMFVWAFNTTDAVILSWCSILKKDNAYTLLNVFWIMWASLECLEPVLSHSRTLKLPGCISWRSSPHFSANNPRNSSTQQTMQKTVTIELDTGILQLDLEPDIFRLSVCWVLLHG